MFTIRILRLHRISLWPYLVKYQENCSLGDGRGENIFVLLFLKLSWLILTSFCLWARPHFIQWQYRHVSTVSKLSQTASPFPLDHPISVYQRFMEYLFYIRHCPRCWRYRCRQDGWSPWPCGAWRRLCGELIFSWFQIGTARPLLVEV